MTPRKRWNLHYQVSWSFEWFNRSSCWPESKRNWRKSRMTWGKITSRSFWKGNSTHQCWLNLGRSLKPHSKTTRARQETRIRQMQLKTVTWWLGYEWTLNGLAAQKTNESPLLTQQVVCFKNKMSYFENGLINKSFFLWVLPSHPFFREQGPPGARWQLPSQERGRNAGIWPVSFVQFPKLRLNPKLSNEKSKGKTMK